MKISHTTTRLLQSSKDVLRVTVLMDGGRVFERHRITDRVWEDDFPYLQVEKNFSLNCIHQ